MAHTDAGRRGALVVGDHVVADLEEAGVTVDHDTAGLIRTGDRESIDARWQARAEHAIPRCDQHASALEGREQACARLETTFRVRVGGVVRLPRKQTNTARRRRRIAIHPAVRLDSPVGNELARRLRRIDDGRCRAPTLQLHGLGHDQHFGIAARRHEYDAARRRLVDRSLDAATRCHRHDLACRHIDTHGHGMDSLQAAVAAGDLELSAAGAGRNRDGDQVIVPTGHVRGDVDACELDLIARVAGVQRARRTRAESEIAIHQQLRAAVHALRRRIGNPHGTDGSESQRTICRARSNHWAAAVRGARRMDDRRAGRIFAIELPVAIAGESRDRQDRRIEIGRLTRREVEGVAELRIVLVEMRIGNPLAAARISRRSRRVPGGVLHHR